MVNNMDEAAWLGIALKRLVTLEFCEDTVQEILDLLKQDESISQETTKKILDKLQNVQNEINDTLNNF